MAGFFFTLHSTFDILSNDCYHFVKDLCCACTCVGNAICIRFRSHWVMPYMLRLWFTFAFWLYLAFFHHCLQTMQQIHNMVVIRLIKHAQYNVDGSWIEEFHINCCTIFFLKIIYIKMDRKKCVYSTLDFFLVIFFFSFYLLAVMMIGRNKIIYSNSW